MSAMPAMLRRRAGAMGKMALETAYRCLDGKVGVPTVFCSRHGECTRSVELLADLVQGQPLSPTSFSLSVHNAAAGLFSVARRDQASHSAMAAGRSGVEHAVIEACGLLADGAAEVLLVVYDGVLPEVFFEYQDCQEQPFAWAWLMRAESADAGNLIGLSWSGEAGAETNAAPLESNGSRQPGGLEVLAFYLRQDRQLVRKADGRNWCWSRLV
ncbi:beta-ketoacyl synthase, N-terminal domain protein [Collimonas fungivorans]|uniref:Beta-ketoacyl synthase, N-terminal domain protein n=1 Tax=Collimonas fungivorans TaxID=158899 RepID=A0A127PB83_9BURK|nr:beta-ketoacyl synthase chain length factor [Collimonas fungivorans]AMO95018.1 beta-ketoacyl synthase, N-terminal domain protein [Collimonas fungivorans]